MPRRNRGDGDRAPVYYMLATRAANNRGAIAQVNAARAARRLDDATALLQDVRDTLYSEPITSTATDRVLRRIEDFLL